MWSRKRVAIQREQPQPQPQHRDGEEEDEQEQQSGGEEIAEQGKDVLRSQAVQVSPERVTRRTRRRGDSTAAEAGVQVDARSFNAVSDDQDDHGGGGDGADGWSSMGEEESTTARVDRERRREAGGGRGRGRGRMRWRWASSRRLEPKSETGDVTLSGGSSSRNCSSSSNKSVGGSNRDAANCCAGGGGSSTSSYSPSPSRLSLRRRCRDVTPAALPAPGDARPAAATLAATVAVATPVTSTPRDACLKRRRSFPRRGVSVSDSPSTDLSTSTNSSNPDLPTAAAGQDSAAANTAAVAAAAAAAAASLVLSSLDDGNKKPECLMASMLLNKGIGSSGDTPEPLSPATSISSDSGSAPSWGERVGLSGGVAVVAASRSAAGHGCRRAQAQANGTESRRKSPLGNECCVKDPSGRLAAKDNGHREVPRFLRPVIVLLTLSLLAIGGAKLLRVARGRPGGERWAGGSGGGGGGGGGVLLFGPAAYAAGGVQLPEAVVDDIFERADKDNDGVIGDEEIQDLVEGAGGSLLDDASEIEAGVASVMKNLDRNEDRALSRSDLNTYWDRLGTLLTVDEAAQWVLHAAQLPHEVADSFVNNMVTGYDFPELAARQGALLEQDLGISRPAFKRTLVRSMQWKLWGMGEEPAAPTGLRAANASCGAVSLEWDQNHPSNRALSFPVHKYVLRRARLGPEGERDGDWTTVMAAAGGGGFFDAGLQPGAAYRYALQAWNALGHSSSVEIDVTVATEDCRRALGGSWYWSPAGGAGGAADGTVSSSLGGLVVATLVSAAAALCFRALGGGGGGGGGWGDGGNGGKGKGTTSSLRSPSPRRGEGDKGRGGGSGSVRRETERRRRSDAVPAVTGTAENASSAAASDGEGSGGRSGSPLSVKSNGSGRSGGGGGSGSGPERDRDHFETHRRLLGPGHGRPSASTSARFAPSSSAPSKDKLRKSSSDVAATARGAPPSSKSVGNLGHGRAQGGGEGGGGATISTAAIGDSVRRERARRMASRKNSSREEKDVCKECGKEWRWYRPAKHTCCKCHDKFCDRKECGFACHSFGACPVGGTCKCRSCELLDEGRRTSSSPAMSFDR